MSNFELNKKAYLTAVWKAGAVKIAPDSDHLFPQRNGNQTWIFIDHGDAILEPTNFLPMVEGLAEYLETTLLSQQTILMNIVSKSSPQLTGALAYKLKVPQIGVISPDLAALEKGTYRQFRLPPLPSQEPQIIIVDDILTTGKTVLETAELLRALPHADISSIPLKLLVCLVRNPTVVTPLLEQSNITPHWIATLDEVIMFGWERLSHSQQEGILTEMPYLVEIIN